MRLLWLLKLRASLYRPIAQMYARVSRPLKCAIKAQNARNNGTKAFMRLSLPFYDKFKSSSTAYKYTVSVN